MILPCGASARANATDGGVGGGKTFDVATAVVVVVNTLQSFSE